jgi:phosphate:Na+ symporter
MSIINIFAFALNVIGGLGLFLYGLKILSNNLQRVSSNRLKAFMDFLTKNKVMGVAFGALVTSILQSSSATTVIMIGFANAGIIGLAQCISIIFGANIGTTITAQIIAFKASNLALPLIGAGSLFFLFSKDKKWASFGEILIGLGLLFYGLKLLGVFLKPLKDSPQIVHYMTQFGQVPLLGIFIGMVVTFIVQSSSAATGMIITLAALGLIDFQGAFCLALGTNIGTTITAQIASVGTNLTARRAAWAHTLFNVFGALYMYLLLFVKVDGDPIFLRFINTITPGNAFVGENLARHIANAHTIFNILNAIVLFPLIGFLAKVTEVIVPGKLRTKRSVCFLDPRIASSPAIALEQVSKETVYMVQMAKEMTKYVYQLLYREKKQAIPLIEQQEDILNEMQYNILTFLVEVNPRLKSVEDTALSNALLLSVESLERIGDHNMSVIFHFERLKELEKGFPGRFSEDIKRMMHNLQEMFQYILAFFESGEEHYLPVIRRFHEATVELEKEIRSENLRSVQDKHITAKAGIIFMEIIGHLDRIRDHLGKIAKQIPAFVSN